MRTRRPTIVGSFVALRLAASLIGGLSLTACDAGRHAPTSTAASPTAPTPVASGVRAALPVDSGTGAAGAAIRTPDVPLGLVAASIAAPAPFPPRDETFGFRLDLEQIYRTELGRSPTLHAFDVEGDLVWTQEYMRYRVYGCGHLDAVRNVFEQIDQRGIAAPCGEVPGGAVRFPPSADTSDFRHRLDTKYRDDFGRTPSPAFVDDEGAIVWTEIYLRYRVFACDDASARAAVRTIMFGGAAPPFCFTTAPPREFLGRWSGVIAMSEPRPFTLELTGQRGSEYFGTYRDIAAGSAGLTWDGEDRIEMFVYFGDGSAAYQGQFIGPNRVRGTMKYDKIATVFGFEMTRH
jgi:hypothetical protein